MSNKTYTVSLSAPLIISTLLSFIQVTPSLDADLRCSCQSFTGDSNLPEKYIFFTKLHQLTSPAYLFRPVVGDGNPR